MTVLTTIISILQVLSGVAVMLVVLMQSGKDKRLSGSIAGGADTYFGKSKGRSWDKILARVTTVVAILFAILTVVTYVLIAKH